MKSATIEAVPVYDGVSNEPKDSPCLYKVTFEKRICPNAFKGRHPYTSKVCRRGVRSLLFKIRDPALGLGYTNWAENEVAGMHLARQALDREVPSMGALVPDVYA